MGSDSEKRLKEGGATRAYRENKTEGVRFFLRTDSVCVSGTQALAVVAAACSALLCSQHQPQIQKPMISGQTRVPGEFKHINKPVEKKLTRIPSVTASEAGRAQI